jgi:CRP/FNR family cyclic AMP-dependent transcriptional regulator
LGEHRAGLITLLRELQYFAHLDDEILQAVTEVARMRHYSPDEIIFLEGDPCAGLFIVQSGRVKIFEISVEGREQSLHFVGPGRSFNDVAALDGGPNPATVVAMQPTTCVVIDRDSMVRLVKSYPALALAVIESIAARTRHLVTLVEDLSFRSVQARLARLLLEEAQARGRGDQVPRLMTQQEMAARLGTVREVVGRALRALEDRGVIRIQRHRIVILDRKELERQALL